MQQHTHQNTAPKSDNHTPKAAVSSGKENTTSSSKTSVLQAKQVDNINNSSLMQQQHNTNNIIQFGKQKWRTKSVDREIKAYSGKRTSKGHVIDTGHHKLSKSKLKTFYNLLTSEKRTKLHKLLAIDGLKGLQSLRSNLALGMNSDKREDDPGDGFDANTFSDGTMTPRSSELKAAEGTIDKGGLTPEDMDEVIRRLAEAERLHKKKVPSGKIDDDISMWDETDKDDKPHKRGPVDSRY